MPDDEILQITAIFKNAKNIALLLSVEPGLDQVVSAYAFRSLLEKAGIGVSIISASGNIPKTLFLPEQAGPQSAFGSSDQLAVKISNAHAKPGELRYEMEADGVVIYLKAKEGNFSATDVSVLPSGGKYDAIVALGVSNLDQLGKIYTDNPSVFFETPIINIDNNPSNDYFGTVNLVNVKAGSIAEIAFDIIEQYPEALADDTVSTGLLAGIIEQTQSFRDPKTTPSTLSKASRLVASGARQQDIIQHLFKTKPFSTLQLWGRAMARLVSMREKSFLYTAITKSDLEKTGSGSEVLSEVLRDLVEMVSDFSVIALAAELPDGVRLLIAGMPHIKVSEVLQKLGAPLHSAHHLVGKFEYAESMLPDLSVTEIQNRLAQILPAQ
jgi:nanoRNase/pAp phosphatase (c-di-AMP/oligoRNAs hydrolase)